MDGWNMILSFWVVGLFSGAFAVSFRRWISGWELWAFALPIFFHGGTGSIAQVEILGRIPSTAILLHGVTWPFPGYFCFLGKFWSLNLVMFQVFVFFIFFFGAMWNYWRVAWWFVDLLQRSYCKWNWWWTTIAQMNTSNRSRSRCHVEGVES